MESNIEWSSLQSVLANAPGHPVIWTQFLAELTRQLKFDSGYLLASDLCDSSKTRFLFSAYISKEYQQLYENKLNRSDDFNHLMCKSPNQIFYHQQSKELSQSHSINTFVPPQQQWQRCGVAIPCNNHYALSLLLHRHDVFTETEQQQIEQVLQHLLPDLDTAIHTEQHHKISSQLRQSLENHFDSYIIVDADLNIVFAEPIFTQVIQQIDCVKIVNNRFGMKNSAIEQRLISLVNQKETGSIHNQCQSCQITLIPIASLKNLYPWECFKDGFILTFTHDIQQNRALERLTELYRLSHCEAACALHFMQTPSIADIAQNTFRSQETVRNHIKHVMQKMDAHSQAELMKKLITLASL